MAGIRLNTGKPKWHMLWFPALEQAVKVLMAGEHKYPKDNWTQGFEYSTVLDSMTRHLVALQNGEDTDPETGLPHYAHIICNAMIYGYNSAHYPGLDDRRASPLSKGGSRTPNGPSDGFSPENGGENRSDAQRPPF